MTDSERLAHITAFIEGNQQHNCGLMRTLRDKLGLPLDRSIARKCHAKTDDSQPMGDVLS